MFDFLLGKEAKLISELLNKPEEWTIEIGSPITKMNHISGLFIEVNIQYGIFLFKYPLLGSSNTQIQFDDFKLNKTIKFGDFEYTILHHRTKKLFELLSPESPKPKEDNFITYFENWKNNHG